MSEFFQMVGVFACIVVVFTIIAVGIEFVRSKVRDWKYAYIRKHRFDKPPTAKCYCIDCVNYSKHNESCRAHRGWSVADSWFCWSAEPKKRMEERSEE